jgi:hypothetical protein
VKNLLIIVIALVLLLCIAVLGTRPDAPPAPVELDTSAGPAFVVQVVKPRSNRPLFGLLPDGAFGAQPNLLVFTDTNPGAEIGAVAHDRLELRADGFDLLIEFDGDGQLAPGTRLVFDIELANKPYTLRCLPADGATGHLRITSLEGADELAGDFRVELADCEKADTGSAVDWPSRALVVRGSFAGVRRP